MTQHIALADLVSMDNPDRVLSEIKRILLDIHPNFDFLVFESTWHDLVRLYRGEYVGYKACSTYYHDLQHTTDCVIALTRLIHGAHYSNLKFTPIDIEMGLVSALFHDVGYILKVDDPIISGGTYTPTHIPRGIEFIGEYLLKYQYNEEQIQECANMMLCTGLENYIPDISFINPKICMMGKMLGSADLIGQMGDRTYLEKLPFLYREFLDANLGAYENEFDFFKKSVVFYGMIQVRLDETLEKCYRYAQVHFKRYSKLDKNLYVESIDKNMVFLQRLLDLGEDSLYKYLKRGGRMKQLAELDEFMNRVVL